MSSADAIANAEANSLTQADALISGYFSRLAQLDVIFRIYGLDQIMAGIKALRKVQLGRESVAGTAVAATTVWRGDDHSLCTDVEHGWDFAL